MVKVSFTSTKGFRMTIPVPYFALRFATTIVCSNLVWRRMIRHHNHKLQVYRPINKQFVKPLLKTTIKELQNYRGMTIVKIQESGGIMIRITL